MSKRSTPVRASTLRVRLRAYHDATRGTWSSFLMGVPLTLAYASSLVFGPVATEQRDFFIRLQVDLLGESIYKQLQIGLAITFVVLLIVLARRGRFRPSYFGPLVVESMGYASMFALATLFALPALHLTPPVEPPLPAGMMPLVSALGEAVNQETFFRWILLEVLLVLTRRYAQLGPLLARSIGVVVGTAVYAGVGTFIAPLPTNDPVDIAARFTTLGITGALLCILYYWRGYPACAYTHVFYGTFRIGVLPYLGRMPLR